MAKPTTSRTTGPLHFEDLEPDRFEDLVRRLIYDFRPWGHLEATGRSGADEGFDVRGIETISDLTNLGPPDDEAEPREIEQNQDRVWLVQCKREKTIAPKKLAKYLDDIPAPEAPRARSA